MDKTTAGGGAAADAFGIGGRGAADGAHAARRSSRSRRGSVAESAVECRVPIAGTGVSAPRRTFVGAHAVHKKIDRWYSPNLGKEMPIVRYGEVGMPILFFPTAAADFLEYERFRLMDSIAHFVDSGLISAFSIDSINADGWLNKKIPPGERAWKQVLFDRYVTHEVVPFIRGACRSPDMPIVTTGASFGAFHALNETLKHPDIFNGVIAMSGVYDIRPSCDGYHDDNVYFNNPVEYVPRLADDRVLEQLRRCRITIVAGQGAYEDPQASRDMAGLLQQKGVPVNLDLWGHDVKHDWPWWNKMLNHYIPLYFR
jgi:esterase/lipase superfamily enzyme